MKPMKLFITLSISAISMTTHMSYASEKLDSCASGTIDACDTMCSVQSTCSSAGQASQIISDSHWQQVIGSSQALGPLGEYCAANLRVQDICKLRQVCRYWRDVLGGHAQVRQKIADAKAQSAVHIDFSQKDFDGSIDALQSGLCTTIASALAHRHGAWLRLTVEKNKLGRSQRLMSCIQHIVAYVQSLGSDIVYLNLGFNKIRNIEPGTFSHLTNLRGLALCANELSTLQPGILSDLPNLSMLWLHDNQLTCLQAGVLSNLRNLIHVTLDCNCIKTLEPGSFDGLAALRNLTMSENQLTAVSPELFKDLTSLSLLELSNNQLLGIEQKAFSTNKKLRIIDLHGNQIDTLTSDTFRDLPNLHWLWLHGNPLTHVATTALYAALQSIEIGFQ